MEAANGDNESKELLALWLLKGNIVKDLSTDFYERYGRGLLRADIKHL